MQQVGDSRKRAWKHALTLLMVGLAVLIPAWVVWGRWLTDTLDRPGSRSPFFVVWLLSLAALGVLAHWAPDSPEESLRSDLSSQNTAVRSKPPAGQMRLGRGLHAAALVGFGVLAVVSPLRRTVPGWDLVLILLAWGLGWLLTEVSVDGFRQVWLRQRDWLGPYCLALAAFLVLADQFYSTNALHWAAVLLFGLAAFNLARSARRVPPMAWLAVLGLALGLLNMNNWLYAAIGDEYDFFTTARRIASQGTLESIGAALFKGTEVFGAHPYFSSLLQAAWMKLFGLAGFGWRSLNAALCALALPFFYIFFKTFLRRSTALLACFFLAVSHYLMSFSKIGYNNLQAYFAEALLLAAAAWVLRSGRRAVWVGLGAAAGLCFYVYPAALYLLPLPFLLLLLYRFPHTWSDLQDWGCAIGTLFMLVFPLMLQPMYWSAKLPGTFLNNPEASGTSLELLLHLLVNLFYALLSPLFINNESHFVTFAYLDPLSGALFSLGLALSLKRLRANRFMAFWLGSFGLLLLLVGASHDRDFPPNTRMFLLLPWFACFAALGLDWLIHQVRAVRPHGGRVLFWTVLAAALAANLFQAYGLVYQRSAGVQSLETLFVRTARRVEQVLPAETHTYVFVSAPDWGITGLYLLQQVYPQFLGSSVLLHIPLEQPVIPAEYRALISRESTMVVLTPFMDDRLRTGLISPLTTLGKQLCPVLTATGEPRFQIAVSGRMAAACQPYTPINISTGLLWGLVLAAALGADWLIMRSARRRLEKQAGGDPSRVVMGGQTYPLLSLLKDQKAHLSGWFHQMRGKFTGWKGRGARLWPLLGLAGALITALGQLQRQQWYGRSDLSLLWLALGLFLFGAALALTTPVTIVPPDDLGWRLSSPTTAVDVLDRAAAWLGVNRRQTAFLALSVPLMLLAAAAAGSASHMRQPAVAVTAWLGGIGLVMWGGWRNGSGQHLPWRSLLFWTAVLVAAAVSFRFLGLSSIPRVAMGDEASMGISAARFVQGQTDNLFGVGWFSFPALYYFIQSLSIRVFGQNYLALRVPSAVVGVLTVIGVFWVGRAFFGKRAGLAAGLLLAVLHYHVHFSRTGLNNIWDGLFFVLVLGFFLLAWTRLSRPAALLAGLALGLSQYFYVTSRALLGLVPLLVLLFAWRDRSRLKAALPNLLLMAWAALAVVFPLGWHYLYSPSDFTSRFAFVQINSQWLNTQMQTLHIPVWLVLARQAAAAFQAYTDIQLHPWYASGTPMLLTLQAVLFWLGLAVLVTRWRKPAAQVVLAWLVTFGLIGFFSQGVPAGHRYVAAAPAAALTAGLGLDGLLTLLLRRWPRARLAAVGLALVLLAGAAWQDGWFYFRYFVPQEQDPAAEVGQVLAAYLHGKPAQIELYFFGSPGLGADIPNLMYLAPSIKRRNNPEAWGSAANPPPHPLAVYAFTLNHAADLAHAQAELPGGRTLQLTGLKGQPMLWVYDLTP